MSNRTVGLVVVCPITNQKKGYPWEIDVPESPHVSGAVLADQMKDLDWRARHAEFLCTPDVALLEDGVEKAVALLTPEEE